MEQHSIGWVGSTFVLGFLCLFLLWSRAHHHAQLRELRRLLERIAIPPYQKVSAALHHEIERARRLGYELSLVSVKMRPRTAAIPVERHLLSESNRLIGANEPVLCRRLVWSGLWVCALMKLHGTTRVVDVIASDFDNGDAIGFLLLLPGTGEEGTLKLVERLREQVGENLDLAIGTAHFPGDAAALDDLVELARRRAVCDESR